MDKKSCSKAFYQINAYDILKMIESGQDISCHNYIIIGDLDANKIKLPKLDIGHSEWIYNKLNRSGNNCIKEGKNANFVTSKISLINCVICGSIKFNKTIFYEAIDFSGSDFEGEISFCCSKFNKSVIMNGAKFNKLVNLNGVIFRREFNCKRCEFKGVIRSLNSIFYKNISFEEARFNNIFDFRGSEFRGKSFFWHCAFYRNARFDRTRFCCGANFSGTNCERCINFTDAKVSGDAIFNYARFREAVYFNNFNVNRDLNLNKSRIYSLSINPNSDVIHISMTDADFNRLIVPWDYLKNKIDYDGVLYLSLIKNYKNLGWFDDEDQCYFSHREKIRSKKPRGLSQFLDYISLHLCGYGIEPKYALKTSLKIIIVFSLIFFMKFVFFGDTLEGDLIIKSELPIDIAAILSSDNLSICIYLLKKDSLFPNYVSKLADSLYLSMSIFLSQIPNNLYSNGIWRFVVMIERISGWVLMALFIVVLTKKLIR